MELTNPFLFDEPFEKPTGIINPFAEPEPTKPIGEPPIGKNGKHMDSFEERVRWNSKIGTLEKIYYINGEHFDWAIDIPSLAEAMKMGPKYFKAIKEDIQKHFVDCVSEVLNRQVSLEEIKTAIKTNWI